MRTSVVMSSELHAVDSWRVADFMADAATRFGCHLCGLVPANIDDARRPNPRTGLLELDGIDESDPLQRSLYRCRNREGCERRQRLKVDLHG